MNKIKILDPLAMWLDMGFATKMTESSLRHYVLKGVMRPNDLVILEIPYLRSDERTGTAKAYNKTDLENTRYYSITEQIERSKKYPSIYLCVVIREKKGIWEFMLVDNQGRDSCGKLCIITADEECFDYVCNVGAKEHKLEMEPGQIVDLANTYYGCIDTVWLTGYGYSSEHNERGWKGILLKRDGEYRDTSIQIEWEKYKRLGRSGGECDYRENTQLLRTICEKDFLGNLTQDIINRLKKHNDKIVQLYVDTVVKKVIKKPEIYCPGPYISDEEKRWNRFMANNPDAFAWDNIKGCQP